VAVLRFFVEGVEGCLNLFDGDRRGVGLVQAAEECSRRFQDELPFRHFVVDRVQGEGTGLADFVRVLEVLRRPFDGREQLRRAYPTVLIGVDEREGSLVEMKPGHGAGQRDPEFLVEIFQADEVAPRSELYLIDPTSPKEAKWLSTHGRSHRLARAKKIGRASCRERVEIAMVDEVG